MRKNVLVIGGSYFAGRVFNILTSRTDMFELHVVNRGKAPLNNLSHVTQYQCDRHEPMKMAALLPDIKFDAVIDFCAYSANDIKQIIEAMKDRIGQYIYISTSSVYDPGITTHKKETDEVVVTDSDDPVDEYIAGKAVLELECMAYCKQYDIPFTILRPSFIYGPFNYAPRESYYIEKIVRHKPVPVTTDCNTKFNFLYVYDLTYALQACVGNEKAYNDIFNLAGPEDITYDLFIQTLEKVSDVPFVKEPHTVDDVLKNNIPLPFPLENDDLCDGSKITEKLGLKYTPFEEGMSKTFQIFKNVYS
ncbi:MAG: NAD-dependent epimerase/dehydratase family protein [Oscillospiraceae bacterium]|nr:NAD-dependent epimerase/dehydratase family protein [Oscillospiraceae bacterium]